MRQTFFAAVLGALALAFASPLLAQGVDRAQAEKLAADMKGQLAANPADATLRTQVVLLYLVAFDDPARASQFLAEGIDPGLLKYVPVAAKPLNAASEPMCLELGRWYRSLSGIAYPWARYSMFARARGYFVRYLTLHARVDKDRSDAEKDLKSIEDHMTPLCADPSTAPECCYFPTGRWTEVLPFTDLAKDAQGKLGATGWTQKGTALVAADPNRDTPRTQLPVYLQGSYDLQVRFIGGSTTPKSQVLLFLPVGAGYTTLKVGGKPAGLDKVADKSPGQNSTFFDSPLASDCAGLIEVQVRLNGDQATLLAALDGKSVVRWVGPQSDLTASGGLRAKDRLGIGYYDGTATFASVQVRSGSGRNILLHAPLGVPKK